MKKNVLVLSIASAMVDMTAPLLQVRPHRGSLAEAMSQSAFIPATTDAIARHFDVSGPITVAPYGGVDPRTGWNTYLICSDGRPCGFADGPLRTTPSPATERGSFLEK